MLLTAAVGVKADDVTLGADPICEGVEGSRNVDRLESLLASHESVVVPSLGVVEPYDLATGVDASYPSENSTRKIDGREIASPQQKT